jgi:hypothetical protein
MFSERIHNWAKIFELLTGTMKAIAIVLIPEAGALHSTGPQVRSYRTSVHQPTLETQREWAVANARIASLNR